MEQLGNTIKQIRSNIIKPSYMLMGNEVILYQFFISEILKCPEFNSYEKLFFDLIVDEEDQCIRSLDYKNDLFNSGELIVIKNIDLLKNEDNLAVLMKACSEENNRRLIVLLTESTTKSKKVIKQISKLSCLVNIDTPKDKQKLTSIINWFCSREKIKITNLTIEKLIEIYGKSITDIMNEINKINLFYNQEKKLDETIFQSLSIIKKDFQLWELAKAVGAKRSRESLEIVDKILISGGNFNQFISYFSKIFCDLLKLKYKVINEDFRLRSFNRNYNLVQTKNVIRLLIKMDFLIKNYNQKILINYFHITTLRIING